MVFSSNVFLFLFLPLVLGLYYITPVRFRNLLLLAASLFFYAWGEPRHLIIMVFIILLNYFCGRGIAAKKSRGESAKPLLILAIVLNLAVLVFFKYAMFLLSSLKGIFSGISVPEIRLPIGISFYIFQSMSYTIDVYRGNVNAQRNPVTFAAYVSLFPQLIAGPIVRYVDVEQQLEQRSENLQDFTAGIEQFIIGLAKKVLIANQVGALWQLLSVEQGTLAAWTGMIAYTLQIYFDFSGYSDMACGLGKMFGFNFVINFDYPYISQSITEFWRRWHISLSTWFREYVYIPLGGNRRGVPRQLLNILIVWTLTGLWHGASWNFVLWGMYYAILLIVEKTWLLKRLDRVPSALRRIAVLLAVSVGWMLFYFEDMGTLGAFLRELVTLRPTSVHVQNSILAYLPVLAAGAFFSTPLCRSFCEGRKDSFWFRTVLCIVYAGLFLLCVASLASQSYNPFIYFRF